MDSTTAFISIIIILVALATNLILTQTIRRRRDSVPLRVIPAFEGLPLLIGESIEADRPVHLSFGSAGLGGNETLLTLANAEFFYHVIQHTATGAVSPIITASNPATIPLAQDTLRRAYAARGRMERLNFTSARWYPAGGDALPFAAALTVALANDEVSGNIISGTFGTEIALVLDAANRRDQRTIATSSRLEGQAIAWALSEQPLIGEEVFTAGAYLSETPSQRAIVASMDILRGALIVIIIVPTIIAMYEPVSEALARLMAGGQ